MGNSNNGQFKQRPTQTMADSNGQVIIALTDLGVSKHMTATQKNSQTMAENKFWNDRKLV